MTTLHADQNSVLLREYSLSKGRSNSRSCLPGIRPWAAVTALLLQGWSIVAIRVPNSKKDRSFAPMQKNSAVTTIPVNVLFTGLSICVCSFTTTPKFLFIISHEFVLTHNSNAKNVSGLQKIDLWPYMGILKTVSFYLRELHLCSTKFIKICMMKILVGCRHKILEQIRIYFSISISQSFLVVFAS